MDVFRQSGEFIVGESLLHHLRRVIQAVLMQSVSFIPISGPTVLKDWRAEVLLTSVFLNNMVVILLFDSSF